MNPKTPTKEEELKEEIIKHKDNECSCYAYAYCGEIIKLLEAELKGIQEGSKQTLKDELGYWENIIKANYIISRDALWDCVGERIKQIEKELGENKE
jgi:hypothetical protein